MITMITDYIMTKVFELSKNKHYSFDLDLPLAWD